MKDLDPLLKIVIRTVIAFLVILLVIAAGSALAQTIDQSQVNKSSGSYNAGTGNVKATAKQQQQQAMQQSQNIVVNVPDSLGAFTQTGMPLATSDIDFTSIIPDNTPNINAGSLYPSNPCHMVFNAGVSLPGFGANGGKTYIDQECSARELARMFYGFGARDIAFHILCEQADARGIPGCSGVQDYNNEIALAKTNIAEFERKRKEMLERIGELNDENEHLRELAREERMRKAVSK